MDPIYSEGSLYFKIKLENDDTQRNHHLKLNFVDNKIAAQAQKIFQDFSSCLCNRMNILIFTSTPCPSDSLRTISILPRIFGNYSIWFIIYPIFQINQTHWFLFCCKKRQQDTSATPIREGEIPDATPRWDCWNQISLILPSIENIQA